MRSKSPLHDNVSEDTSYDFYNFNIDDYYDDINSYHDSPIRPKCAEKTIQAAGNPLDHRKTRSQFHNAFSACELNLVDS